VCAIQTQKQLVKAQGNESFIPDWGEN
jgi:hypothetical protein